MWVKNVQWHREAEVVVVGYGGAGRGYGDHGPRRGRRRPDTREAVREQPPSEHLHVGLVDRVPVRSRGGDGAHEGAVQLRAQPVRDRSRGAEGVGVQDGRQRQLGREERWPGQAVQQGRRTPQRASLRGDPELPVRHGRLPDPVRPSRLRLRVLHLADGPGQAAQHRNRVRHDGAVVDHRRRRRDPRRPDRAGRPDGQRAREPGRCPDDRRLRVQRADEDRPPAGVSDLLLRQPGQHR